MISERPHMNENTSQDINIRGLLLLLWRRRIIIFAIMAIFLSLTFIALRFIPSIYTAQALILVDNDNGSNVSGFSALLSKSSSLNGSPEILNEVERIRSRSFIRLVLENISGATSDENGKFRSLNLPSPAISEEQINDFLDSLTISPIPGANIIQIKFSAISPENAAKITNTIAHFYVLDRDEAYQQRIQKLQNWSESRLNEIRLEVDNAYKDLWAFKERYNLTGNGDALSASAEIETLRSILQGLKESENDALLKVRQKQATPLMQSLEKEKAKILNEIAALTERYGDRHPVMISKREELASIDDDIEAERYASKRDVRKEINQIKARKIDVEAKIDALAKEQLAQSGILIEYQKLELEAQAKQKILDGFLESSKEIEAVRHSANNGGVNILSYAAPPEIPSYPRPLLLLSLSAILSLFIGLSLAILLENIDNTIRSASQLEGLFKFPCLALIPRAPMKKDDTIADFVLNKPNSTIAESVRTLRTVLKLRPKNQNGKEPKTILITSSFPGEGKTTLMSWLARLSAKSGEKVLLIDADLRRSNIHKKFKIRPSFTLVDYLTGRHTLDDVVNKDTKTDLDIIYGGSAPSSALDLLSSEKFLQLLDIARQKYDLILIDSPACLAVSDARMLTTCADFMLYAAAWDHTPKEVIQGGLKQFTDIGYDKIGFVLTNVDVKRHVQYGYGDTIYYYGRYHEDT